MVVKPDELERDTEAKADKYEERLDKVLTGKTFSKGRKVTVSFPTDWEDKNTVRAAISVVRDRYLEHWKSFEFKLDTKPERYNGTRTWVEVRLTC